MSQIRCYVSHPIRGKKGKDATRADMEENNRRAIKFGELLRKRFPTVKFYIPAEHDEFVLEAYMQGSLTESEILDADCAIVRKCNFLLALLLDDCISRGMQEEIDVANHHRIPVFYIHEEDGPVQPPFYVVDDYLTGLMRG